VLVERAVSELGKLDILVNNAAYQMTREGIEQIPDQPAELAPLFAFLASDESSHITGEFVGVTGGKPLP
jgi:NAD(P)-dependent dehydrogenase (short-subunit alcohol dehydrogenase family)